MALRGLLEGQLRVRYEDEFGSSLIPVTIRYLILFSFLSARDSDGRISEGV